jgi:hypothetical protein
MPEKIFAPQNRVARWDIFKPKIPIWINFGGSCMMLIYFTANFRSFGIFYGHLVDFSPFWYIFPRFDMLHQEKYGNPATKSLQIQLRKHKQQPFR